MLPSSGGALVGGVFLLFYEPVNSVVQSSVPLTFGWKPVCVVQLLHGSEPTDDVMFDSQAPG